MKILMLSKRRPQGRDLFTRPYGRFFHLPRLLAEAGHTVCLLLLSYANDPPLQIERNGITWLSESIRPYGPIGYFQRCRWAMEALQPDCVVGFSDTYFGIMATYLARKFGTRSAIDAYDNYESYIPWLIPLHHLWRNALRHADLVTAAGPQLAQLLQQHRPGRPVHIVPMAADPCYLPELDVKFCRRRLGLPLDAPLVGYCGSIYRNRGIQLLFDACAELRRKDREVQLVISGRKERGVRLPSFAKWIGYLPDEDMPYLLNSMNVLAVINQLSGFGRFSYPAKLYEAMACGIPVVATATEPAKWILGNQPMFLANPMAPSELSAKLSRMLDLGHVLYPGVGNWASSARQFEHALESFNRR